MKRISTCHCGGKIIKNGAGNVFCEDCYDKALDARLEALSKCAIHDVSGAKRKVCPICWQPLEDGIVKNMCVNDDCPINGWQTDR
jgi:hypothetical protein